MVFDVVVVGSCVQDLVSYTPRFPKPGESVRGTKFTTGCGGKGANQAVAAARLGAKVAMVGRVGNDVFGPSTVENFTANGVDASCVLVTEGMSTATATITVNSSNGENSIVVVLGANEALTPDDVRRAEEKIMQAKVLTCQLEVSQDTTLAALKLAKQHGVFTIFNPAPGLPNVSDELYRYADVVCPNENEAEILFGLRASGAAELEGVLDVMLEKGVKTAMITLGDKGVVFKMTGMDKMCAVQAPKVTAVDTTGAGDAFVGSLAFFVASMPDLSWQERVRRAVQIASESVQLPGTQASYRARSELPSALFV